MRRQKPFKKGQIIAVDGLGGLVDDLTAPAKILYVDDDGDGHITYDVYIPSWQLTGFVFHEDCRPANEEDKRRFFLDDLRRKRNDG